MRCGSNYIVHVDRRFYDFSPIAFVFGGWIVNLLRYAFVTPIDHCQDCGARSHLKSNGSLVVMIIILCLLGVLPGVLSSLMRQ
jgi:hypothetical protein